MLRTKQVVLQVFYGIYNLEGLVIGSSLFIYFLYNNNILMNYQRAEAAVGAAIAESLRIGVKMQIAVLDEGGHLVAFARMDGAWLGSADIALKVRFYLLRTRKS